MAANSPNDPTQPDDSHIFRRSAPKPAPKKKPVEEPTDLISLEDDEDALGGLPSPNAGEPPSVIVRRGYSEGSAVNLGSKPSGRPDAESGSSIFAHAESLAPSAPGSGWFDTVPPQSKSIPPISASPSDGDLGDSHLVDDHRAHLEADSAAVPIADWKQDQATNSVTESEVLRAFDNLSGRHTAERALNLDDSPDFDATQPSGSNLFPNTTDLGYPNELDVDPSGVDLLNPEQDEERFAGPRSSIFGANSTKESSRVELDEVPPLEETDSSNMMFPPADGGSSIFKGSSPFLSVEGSGVQFENTVPGSADQPSGMVDWSSKPIDDEFQPSLLLPHTTDDEVDAFNDSADFTGEMTDFTAPVAPAKKKSGPVGTAGAGVVVAPPKRRDPIDDEDPMEAPKPKRPTGQAPRPAEPKRGGGLVAWLGGGTLGLLAGAGAFAGLYFADVLPAKDSAKATGPIAAQPTVKDTSEELAALAEKNKLLLDDVKVAKLDAQKAEAKFATTRDELEAKDAALTKAEKDKLAATKEKETAQLALTKAEEDAAKATADSKNAKADLDKAKTEIKVAMTETEKAQAEAKLAMTETEKAKTDTKEAKALAEKSTKDFEEAKKAIVEKTKLAAEAEVKVADAQKKLLTAQAGVDIVVKELKANKLIDDKVEGAQALAALPDTLKKLAAASMSVDAKKAAEALLAAKKDLEASQAAVKLAEEKRLAADKAVVDAKALAETKIAEAMDKVAVAMKETDVAKADAKVQVETAVAKLREEIKKMLATAEADSASLKKEHRLQLAALQETFAAQIAEARKGGSVQITPAEVLRMDRGAREYGAGVLAYQTGSFSDAVAALESAVKTDPSDARYWYFLGLARLELGKKEEAQAAFQKGADLESRSKPNTEIVGEALERIQGTARRELNRYR